MEWCAFVLKAKTKPGILFTDNGDLFTIRLARSGIASHWSLGRQTQGKYSPHVARGIRIVACGLIPESRKFCCGIRNPWALDSGIQLRESGIHVRSDWNLDCSTWNPESTAWNPKYKTVLYSLTWSENVKGVRFLVACSRLRDSGGKSFSNKK